MKVVKFGGTSVANAVNISQVLDILEDASGREKTVAVVSALGGVTDLLERAGTLAYQRDESYEAVVTEIKTRHEETIKGLFESDADAILSELETRLGRLNEILHGIFLINEFSAKTRDKVMSFGELLSSWIITEALQKRQVSATWLDSRTVITTNAQFTQATVLVDQTYQNIRDYFKVSSEQITLMPGFVARSSDGEPTTLGRGGSDYTAALVAAALDADTLEIWTDVSGMYTAHPKYVQQAYPIAALTYQEAMELSHFGAKVLYPPTVQPVLEKEIPIRIKNTFEPEHPGTLITKVLEQKRSAITAISHLDQMGLLTLEGSGMVGVPGVSKRLFDAISRESINVVLITQASSEHSICVGIRESELERAQQAVDAEFAYEISLQKIDPAIVEIGMAIIALVGDRMKSHQGISGRMFSALGKNNVNIRAIAQGASERNITAVIAAKDVKKALNTLHSRFFEKQVTTLNLFIMGVGNVGSRLLAQIKQQQNTLLERLRIDLRVVGIANSRTMYFDEDGVDLSQWKEALAGGATAQFETWLVTMKQLNLRNSIFVDITANESVAQSYSSYLKESIAVVACNKIACSADYTSYKELKELSVRYDAPFLFETNVGAGLPVINTLQNLIHSGDTVTSIEAVLSGSLNFIFNHFDNDHAFADVVQRAQDEGYTEPDPRIDLSGVDVMRKILILARESGLELELEAIENQTFLPDMAQKADSIAAFYEAIQQEAAHFNAIYQKAAAAGNRLKYVATLKDGKASVGLQEIPPSHPFYNLEGKDNIVLFYTLRYTEQPLIIKGAGAGAEVTASGLFGDIITLARK